MHFKKLACVFIFVIAFSEVVFAQGKLVFTMKEPLQTEAGFRGTVGRLEPKQNTDYWWDFYQYSICSMNPDGTDLKRLTTDGTSRRPRMSPDGERIAFISGYTGKISFNIMWTDGSENERYIKNVHFIHDFWWSPKSNAVLVVVEIDRDKDRFENWEVSVTGKIKRWRSERFAKGWLHWDETGDKVITPHNRLLEVLPEGISWPKWSPDGKWIAFTFDRHLALAEPDVISFGRRWSLQNGEPPCDGVVEWSPDGKKILFYVRGEICIAFVNKGRFMGFRNMSLYRGRDATWSPDGQHIAFIGANTSGRRTNEIFIIDGKTRAMHQITSGLNDYYDLHWR